MTNIMNIYIYIYIYIYSRMAAWLTRWFAFWLITRGHSKSIKRRRWYHPLSHRQYRHSPAQGIKMNPDESNWIKLGRMLCIWECGVHGVHTASANSVSFGRSLQPQHSVFHASSHRCFHLSWVGWTTRYRDQYSAVAEKGRTQTGGFSGVYMYKFLIAHCSLRWSWSKMIEGYQRHWQDLTSTQVSWPTSSFAQRLASLLSNRLWDYRIPHSLQVDLKWTLRTEARECQHAMRHTEATCVLIWAHPLARLYVYINIYIYICHFSSVAPSKSPTPAMPSSKEPSTASKPARFNAKMARSASNTFSLKSSKWLSSSSWHRDTDFIRFLSYVTLCDTLVHR